MSSDVAPPPSITLAALAWHVGVGAAAWTLCFAVGRATLGASSGEYFLSEHVTEAWLAHWPWIAPVQILLGATAGRLGRVRWWSTIVACVALYLVPVFLEFVRDDTSHNLIPFELGYWAFACLPIALGAWLGGIGRRRSARPGN